MRAAIEASRYGADVAVVSKLHPTRSHSGAAEGGINAALGNAVRGLAPSSTPSSPSRAPTTSATRTRSRSCARRGPGDIYELEHMGCIFSRTPDGKIAQRPFGAGGAPRTCYAADITGHVLLHVLYEQLVKSRGHGLRGVVRARPGDGRRALRRPDRVGSRPRRRAGRRGGRRRARDRRPRPHVPRHHQRLRLHRRRHVDGLARGRAAQGHGVHAVSPDDAQGERRPHHRGLPRRGRLPAQRRGRPVHVQLRAERRRAGVARRRVARRSRPRSTRAAASTGASCST